jgi:cell division transport system permease protein
MARPSALPSARTSAMGGFISGIVAVLVFISGIALTAAGTVGGLLQTWNTSVTGTMTVQISGTAAESAKAVQAVIATARASADVSRAEAVARERMQELLKPWLGDDKLIADLPLPALIDIELRTPTPDAVARVSAAIKTAAPSAVIDDHRAWLNRIADLAVGLSTIAFSLIGMSLAALALTVIFATRASLTEHVQVIEVLHLVGARDGYIASQFSWRAVRQTLWGGVIGLLAFAPALGALAWLAQRIDAGILPPLTLPMPYWAGLAALPLMAAIIAFVVARLTVRRALAAMV